MENATNPQDRQLRSASMGLQDTAGNHHHKDVLRVAAAACLVLLARVVAHGDDPAAATPPTSSAPANMPQGNDLQPVALLKEGFPNGEWAFFSGRTDARLESTWRLAVDPETGKGVLICSGAPQGYIRTRTEYSNFELELEWKYPTDANGNSGVFVFTTGPDRIWPMGVQVQLHQPVAGSAFPNGGAKVANELRDVPPVAKPVNQWNHCRIRCENGSIQITVNGVRLGEVTQCEPSSGSIALQSEGSEIHFRNILIRELRGSERVQVQRRTGRLLSHRWPRRYVRGGYLRRHPDVLVGLQLVDEPGIEESECLPENLPLRIRNPRWLSTEAGSW